MFSFVVVIGRLFLPYLYYNKPKRVCQVYVRRDAISAPKLLVHIRVKVAKEGVGVTFTPELPKLLV